MKKAIAEDFIGRYVTVKLRGIKDAIRGILTHVDLSMHEGLGNLIVEDHNGHPLILRGDHVVSISEHNDCGYDACDTCQLDDEACGLDGDPTKCNKVRPLTLCFR